MKRTYTEDEVSAVAAGAYYAAQSLADPPPPEPLSWNQITEARRNGWRHIARSGLGDLPEELAEKVNRSAARFWAIVWRTGSAFWLLNAVSPIANTAMLVRDIVFSLVAAGCWEVAVKYSRAAR